MSVGLLCVRVWNSTITAVRLYYIHGTIWQKKLPILTFFYSDLSLLYFFSSTKCNGLLQFHLKCVLLWRFILNNKSLCLHVKYLIFLPYFNNIWTFSVDVHRNPHYKISWKFFQRLAPCYVRKDGRTDRRTNSWTNVKTKVIALLATRRTRLKTSRLRGFYGEIRNR
jgi:hypothetical protein